MAKRNLYGELLQVFPGLSGLEYGDYCRLVSDFDAAGCSAKEYSRRIGKGNLRAHLDALAVGDRNNARRTENE